MRPIGDAVRDEVRRARLAASGPIATHRADDALSARVESVRGHVASGSSGACVMRGASTSSASRCW